MKLRLTVQITSIMMVLISLSSCDLMATLFHGEKPEEPPVTYTVSFNGNGASGTAPASQTVESGAVITLPAKGNLESTGNVFVGWNENASGSGITYSVGASITVTKDMMFYAQWLDSSTPQYTVTYNANGASGLPPAAQTVYSGISITLPGQGSLTYASKSFDGWNTSSDGSGSGYSAGSSYKVTANTTMYAQWIVTPPEVAGSYTVNNSSTLASAIASINASSKSGTYTITVTASFAYSSPVTFTTNGAKTIVLQGSGGNQILYNNSSDSFFTVPNRITLSLGNNITLNGNQKYYPAVKVTTGGRLEMESGSTITGAKAHGVWVNGGAFTMNAGLISDNYSGSYDGGSGCGGGVYVSNDGVFNLVSGSISGNVGELGGGGVCVNNGTFLMSGGSIESNTAYSAGGGGVIVLENGEFTMTGGMITGNTALYDEDPQWDGNAYGGGVRIGRLAWGGGTFTMSGGSITGNTASATRETYGGGVFIYDGEFIKNGGGTIDDTNSAQYGKVACIYDGGLGDPTVRNTTAGPSDTMDSGMAGSSGGWE